MAHCTCISFKRSINDKLFDNAMTTLYHDWDHHHHYHHHQLFLFIINYSYKKMEVGNYFRIFVCFSARKKKIDDFNRVNASLFIFYLSPLKKIYLILFHTLENSLKSFVERTTKINDDFFFFFNIFPCDETSCKRPWKNYLFCV